jgi:hypothetical protein
MPTRHPTPSNGGPSLASSLGPPYDSERAEKSTPIDKALVSQPALPRRCGGHRRTTRRRIARIAERRSDLAKAPLAFDPHLREHFGSRPCVGMNRQYYRHSVFTPALVTSYKIIMSALAPRRGLFFLFFVGGLVIDFAGDLGELLVSRLFLFKGFFQQPGDLVLA